jgi:hypothetical protein
MGKHNHPRCTKADLEARVTIVLKWISEGKPRPFMVREAAELWQVSTRQFETYHAKAAAEIKQYINRERADYAAEHIFKLESLAAAATAAQQYSAAAAALGMISKVACLHWSQSPRH